MENKKGVSIVLLIPAIIIGVALFKEFDFENQTFENPLLATVYAIGFGLAIFFQVKNFKKHSKKTTKMKS